MCDRIRNGQILKECKTDVSVGNVLNTKQGTLRWFGHSERGTEKGLPGEYMKRKQMQGESGTPQEGNQIFKLAHIKKTEEYILDDVKRSKKCANAEMCDVPPSAYPLGKSLWLLS